MKKTLREFIKEARTEYKKIISVRCPAFDNENIYFNKEGLGHLLRTAGRLRHIQNLIRKIKLLPYAVETIKISMSYKTHQKFENGLEMWSLEETVFSKKIIVVIRRDRKIRYFFSVMDR